MELYESVRSKLKSSLSSSLASRIVWLMRKKAATHEKTIAVDIFLELVLCLGTWDVVGLLDTCERVDD